MTKSKTLIELLEEEIQVDYHPFYRGGLRRALELHQTHQDTEVQRLRDVIERCREALRRIELGRPMGILDNGERAYEPYSVASLIAKQALAECNAVLEDGK